MSDTRLTIRVQPRARREGVSVREDGTVVVAVNAPPEAGKANIAACEVLAGALGVRRMTVRIVSGRASRTKVVELPMDAAEAMARLTA